MRGRLRIFPSWDLGHTPDLGLPEPPRPAEYICHVANRDGLAAIIFVDKDYPARSAFSVLQKVRVSTGSPPARSSPPRGSPSDSSSPRS